LNASSNKGFTLLELSVVIIIIGLIAGGIMVGRYLIRTAELRAVISEIEKFETAVQAFQLKYGCTPGDCPIATNFWGTDPGGCPSHDPFRDYKPKAATCNGSGDGTINNYEDPAYNTYAEEMFRFWQHLANAGFISGSYTGTVSSGGPNTEDAVLGANIPRSKLAGTGWVIHYWPGSAFAGFGSPLDRKYGDKNYFSLVGDPGDNSPFLSSSARALSSSDARHIDEKIDDGKPYGGNVIPLDLIIASNRFNCVTALASPSEYTIGGVTPACSLAFGAGF
jgi:prepilin-type N-terminal cleavage/methylation domain-containing protein